MKKYAQRLSARGTFVLALILLVSFSISAQLPTATILGTVKDSTGGAVAGATVTVTNVDTGFTRSGPTMEDGSYRFPALPVGRYEIKFTRDGFETTQRTGITLVVAQEATIDIALQVGSTSQSVVVTGEAPIVDTTSSSVGNVVNEDKITDLPLNGRNWTDLTLMQPGVTQINALESFGGNVSVPGMNGTMYSTNGATSRSNMFLLDGADERTMIGFNNTSASGTSLGVDGIKEYKVVSVLPSAEYGLTMGSQTTTVSKGGTNQWHGDAFDFLRNASMDAQTYNAVEDTLNLNGCGAERSFAFPCKRVPPFQRNNFGASGGGPIQKDKTFFYAVYEAIRQRQGFEETYTTLPLACWSGAGGVASTMVGGPTGVIQNNGCVPGSATNPITINPIVYKLAQFFPQPNVALTPATQSFNFESPYTTPTTENYGQIRVDHTFSSNDSMFGRYTQDDADTLPPSGSDVRALNGDHSAEHFGTLSETHIFSPTVLNTARLSYSRNIQEINAVIVPSTQAGLPSEPPFQAGLTAFVTDSANVFQLPGTASPGQIPQSCSVALVVVAPGTSPSCPSSGIVSTYGSASALAGGEPGASDQNIATLSDDVFWTKGKHAFKFGTLMNQFSDYPDIIFSATGTVGFPGVNIPNAGSCDATNLNSSGKDVANVNSCPLAAYFEGVYSSIGRSTPNSIFPRQFRNYTYGFYAQDDYKVLSHLTLNLGLRYEFATVPHELIPSLAFSLRNAETDTTGTAGPLFRNPSLHAFSPRVGFAWDVFGNGKTSLRGGAGIYYDIGTYAQLEESNNISTPNGTPGGFVSGTVTFTNPDIQNLAGGTCCTAATTYRPGGTLPPNGTFLGGPSAVEAFSVPLPVVSNTAVPSPRTVDYNLSQPTLVQRSLGVDQQLPWDMALSVSYVGSQSYHIYQEREGNPQAYYATVAGSTVTACPGAACTPVTLGSNGLPFYCGGGGAAGVQPTATNPCLSTATAIPCTTLLNVSVGTMPSCPGKTQSAWNQVSTVTTSGNGYYNSLQVVLNKRTSHGLQLQFGYTWQKLLDTGAGQSTLENTTNVHEFPIAGGGPGGILDRGPSQYNATNGVHANFIYRVPDLVKSESLLGKFIDGWGMSAIETAQSGYPLTPSITGDRTLDGAVFVTERPDLCPSYSAANFKPTATYTGNRATSTYFNTSMLCLPAAGTFGNMPKGLFTGPGIFTSNFSFTKDTRVKYLGEAGNVEFRFEAFNALNHPNFSGPTTTVFSVSPVSECPAGGSITALGAGGCGSAAPSTAGRDSLTTTVPMRQMQVSLKIIF